MRAGHGRAETGRAGERWAGSRAGRWAGVAGRWLAGVGRRAVAWYRARPAGVRWALAWAGLLLAIWPHFTALPMSEPLTPISDVDGLAKLEGIAADPSFGAMLRFFIGDDPQGVHTFRPFPAATLWLEWHLWGFTRWPYQLSNLVWLLLTAGAIQAVARRAGLAPWAGWLAAAWFLAAPTLATRACTGLIATRHDLTCGLAGLLALAALLDWLADGRRRRLAAWFGWSLLAYLSKEMALALLPFGLGLALLDGRGQPRRAWAAAGVTVGCAVLYLGWYHLAEANMGRFLHPTHTFSGMLGKLTYGWRVMAQNTLYLLSWPLGDAVRQIFAAGSLVLWSRIFWAQAIPAVVYLYGFGVLCRHRPRAVAIVFLWKLCTYAPVAPLHDTWPWYRYMPHLLDTLLLPLFVEVQRERWRVRSVAGAAEGESGGSGSDGAAPGGGAEGVT